MNLIVALLFTICGFGFACWYARLGRLKRITHDRARFFVITNVVMALSMVTIFDFASEGFESPAFIIIYLCGVAVLLMNLFNLAKGKDQL